LGERRIVNTGRRRRRRRMRVKSEKGGE